MLLSATMMPKWLGHWDGSPYGFDSLEFFRCALEKAFSVMGILPFEFGRPSVTAEIKWALIQSMRDAG